MRCFSNCWRIVTAPRMSGSTASTVGGGGGVSSPRMRSVIQWPRSTGEVVVPLAVTFRTLACVITPPRRLSAGSFTLRNADAGDAADAVVLGQPLVQEGEVGIDDVPRRQVGAQEFGEEEPRLLQRRPASAGRPARNRCRAWWTARCRRSSGGRASSR